jgi:ABC-2 type transport system ATP-binding protein
MSDCIIVSELVKLYGDKRVLNGINLTVHSNECVGIVGKNGAGKTTLLECIEGIRKWQHGKITVCGIRVPDTHNHLRNIIGVQLQSASLPEEIKVKEVIELFAVEHSISYSIDSKTKFGITELLRKRYKELSTGQKRRLHLLLATLHNPDIIILDEPTAGLDIGGKEELYRTINEYKAQRKTILITSHDIAEVELLCDRVIMIDNGALIEIESTLSSQTDGQEAIVAIRTVNGCLREGFSTVFGTAIVSTLDGNFEYRCSNITGFIKELVSFIDSSNDDILDISLKRKSLRDKIIDIIEGGEQA